MKEDWSWQERYEYTDSGSIPVTLSISSSSDGTITIKGTQTFIDNVRFILKELYEYLPERYGQAIRCLPEVVYSQNPLYGRDGRRVLARSDGKFAIDGSENFGNFRHIFLHEIGHKWCGKQYNDWSEQAAEQYSQTVLAELQNCLREVYPDMYYQNIERGQSMQKQTSSWLGEYDAYFKRNIPHITLEPKGQGRESIPPKPEDWPIIWTEDGTGQIRISYPGSNWEFLIRVEAGGLQAYETDGTPLGPVRKTK